MPLLFYKARVFGDIALSSDMREGMADYLLMIASGCEQLNLAIFGSVYRFIVELFGMV